MKRLLPVLMIVFGVFLGSARESFALPPCPNDTVGMSMVKDWHNCFGTYTYFSGNKYVGEFQYNRGDGHGTYTYADGDNCVCTGISDDI